MATTAAKGIKRTAKPVKVRTQVKKTAPKRVLAPKKKIPQKGKAAKPNIRYKCRLCGYIYSPLRGEPHNGIPAGTAFEDLPDTYVCPVCALDVKITKSYGKVVKQGFDPLNL